MKRNQVTTQDVEKWWDENPFTLGVATNNYKENDLVGRKPIEQMDKKYFSEINRKFRKHHGRFVQGEGKPLLSNLIDYSFLKGKKVLDIAVGTGLHSVAFAEEGADVTAIDLTNFAILQARKNFEEQGLEGEVIKMDAQDMKFPDETFHFVNAWGCLMHMPDTERAINEIYRVLKPKGRALAYMYNRNSWPFWFNIFLLRGILLGGIIRFRGNINQLTSRYSDGSHKEGNMLTKFFTGKEVESIFRKAGFSGVEVFPLQIEHEADHWPMRRFPVFKYLPKRIKFWITKRWGYGLIIKATK